jgi:hypothetical protein
MSLASIVAEIQVSQRWALPKQSCKILCLGGSDIILAEIEVSQRRALRQHFCRIPLYIERESNTHTHTHTHTHNTHTGNRPLRRWSGNKAYFALGLFLTPCRSRHLGSRHLGLKSGINQVRNRPCWGEGLRGRLRL